MPDGNRVADVTVVVVTHDHAEHVVECLESIRTQEDVALQVVLVDDGSTDGTLDLIADYLPGRLAHQVRLLRAQPTSALAYSDARVVDARSMTLADTSTVEFPWPEDAQTRTHPFGELLKRNWIPGASLLLRTAVVRQEGGLRSVPCCEDLELLVRLARSYPFAWSTKPLVAVRRPDQPCASREPGGEQALLRSLDLALRHYEGSGPDLEQLAREKRWELAKRSVSSQLPARETLDLLWDSRAGATTRTAVARQLVRWLRTR